MNRIHVLQPHIANQIAAGEVVERPASVVKELVENALDAKATAVSVALQDGGLTSIRVTDNGTGIAPEDCLVAFERHATSKIEFAGDLNSIETLGFRGEALASIAAVSQVRLLTRTKEDEIGTVVRIEGGSCLENTPAACPEGTVLEVKNLFYNVPARRKFLKSARAETASAAEYVSRMILARPDVSFKLTANDKTLYQSAGNGSLQDAVFAVYGAEVLPHIKELLYDDGYVRYEGYIGTPSISRPNRTAQSFLLNGRYIRSITLSSAVYRAYDTRMMVGRFPFIVLHITLSSAEVDVNVHPTKLEVRFANENRLTSALTAACAKALGLSMAPSITLPESNRSTNPVNTIQNIVGQQVKNVGLTADKQVPTPVKPAIRAELPTVAPTLPLREAAERQPSSMQQKQEINQEEKGEPLPQIRIVSLAKQEQIKRETAPKPVQETFGTQPYSIIGKAFETYWLVQQGESLFLIDQHAAHERKLFETLMAQLDEPVMQPLLIPEIMKLSPDEWEQYRQNAEVLHSLGFDTEEFGIFTLRVLAMPFVLQNAPVAAMLHEVLHTLCTKGKASTVELRREAIIQASCKHAIKGGDTVSKEEIEGLLKEFAKTGSPMTCPHGRPIMTQISKTELEKLFKRIV